jgi:hypothetical protein
MANLSSPSIENHDPSFYHFGAPSSLVRQGRLVGETMSALLLSPAVDQMLIGLREYAESHPMTMADVLRVIQGKLKRAGDNPEHVREVPVGYKVVLSVEEQPVGLCYHVSVSVSRPGKLPHPLAVDEILKRLLGKTIKDSIKTWQEEGHRSSINLLLPKLS